MRYLIEGDFYPTAVSRAYYGMFYLAQTLLLEKGLTTSSHKETISAFGREFARTGLLPREFHAYLIGTQEDRLDTDYDSATTFHHDEAAERLAQLEAFLEAASAFQSPPQSE